MTLGALATFGYADKRLHVARELAWVMRVNSLARLIDTRLHPFCSWATQWNRPQLEQDYGKRYCWRGDWLGNLHHHTPERGIQLADAVRGISWLVHGLEKGYTLILLCACGNEAACHRTFIYEQVRQCLGARFVTYSLGQRVKTPCGLGIIDPHVPLQVHRARNRYAVILELPNGQRYFPPQDLAPTHDAHEHALRKECSHDDHIHRPIHLHGNAFPTDTNDPV